MTGTLLRLTFWSVRNSLRVRLKRLRQPRYAIGLLVAVAYFYLMFGGFSRRSRRGSEPEALHVLERFSSTIEAGGALMMFLLASLSWVWPSKGPALAFSPAEVQFLFTAPVRRRTLVIYRVVRSLFGNLVMSAVMALLFRPPSASRTWMVFAGSFLSFSVLNLHLMGVSLGRASLAAHGWSAVARQWVPIAIVVGVVAIVVTTIATEWAAVATLSTTARLEALGRALSTGAAGIALWPFRALVRLPLSETPAVFLQALPAVILLFAANFIWVLRSDVAFEEASAAAAEKVARLKAGGAAAAHLASRRTRARRPPFRLAPLGRPEFAFLWKNLMLVGRYASMRTLLTLVPAVIVLGAMFGGAAARGGPIAAVAIACAVGAVLTTFIGPQVARNDLRQDLAHLAVLKTWPVRGGAVVRGEAMAPMAVLSALTMLLMTAVFALSGGTRAADDIPFVERITYWASAMLLAPGLITLHLLLQNGLALMFPAWVAFGPRARQGFDVMGQRLLLVYGLLFALLLAVVPAAAVAGLVAYLVYATTGTVPLVVPSAIAAAVMFAEAWAMSVALGRVFDRTDVSAIDAPG